MYDKKWNDSGHGHYAALSSWYGMIMLSLIELRI